MKDHFITNIQDLQIKAVNRFKICLYRMTRLKTNYLKTKVLTSTQSYIKSPKNLVKTDRPKKAVNRFPDTQKEVTNNKVKMKRK